MRDKTCFFTGHRAIAAADIPMVRRALSCAVMDMINRGVLDFIAGGAVGFDMLAADTVAELKCEYEGLRLILYIPCVGHDRRWKNEDKESLERLILTADEVHYISETYDHECMMRRNAAMVRDAYYCLAWYNKSCRGGTAKTVSMAKKTGCCIRNLAIEPW